ncbi:GDSL esterase/lipase 7 [Coffea eugenioides]|uniref:GDSL esterase/lipase 7 n=1 Tax=Coffea eugenioides TaxID=49369 RepID=UPI000F604D54|nr:GDSL esterase/lipase 7 [Coffea eugenioides]
MPLLLILWMVIIPDHILFVKCDSIKGPNFAAPAVYVLGDSLVDSGNNNALPTLAKANFLPYGSNFPTGPTGRFTNGKTVADFVAEFLGLPLIPPYLSLRGFAQANQPGLNYASGSCGILPETGKYIGQCLSFGEQVDLLQLTIELELPRLYETKEKLATYLSRSLFAVSIGSNDYINNYLQPIYDTRTRFSPQSFAKHLVDTLSLQLQRLYRLGARKIFAFEIGPIGCIPSIARNIKHSGQCVEDINGWVLLFNDQLSSLLKNLSSQLPGSNFTLGRIHGLAYDIAKNPSAYGLRDTSNPCCTTWANGTSACILGLPPCPDPNKHYFWDGFHLTEAVYKVVAESCIWNSSICSPNSIKELVTV